MMRAIAAIVVLLLCAAAGLTPLTTDVIPASDLRKRVRMTPVAPNWSSAVPVHTPDFAVSFEQDRFIVTGHDKTNKRWRASLDPAGRGIWKTESLNLRTYYFAGYTGAVGLGPPTWILALSFDATGRPAPFYVDGYSQYDASGIHDLVDLDGTGRPQLIQQDWCYFDWDPNRNNGPSGFWVTTLYQQQASAYWRRADGRHGATTFPLFEKWSRSSPDPPASIKTATAPKRCNADHTNDPSTGFQTSISTVDEHAVRAQGAFNCRAFLPKVVVRDSRAGREIEVEEHQIGPLLRTVVNSGKPVTVTGISTTPEPRHCGVSILWAKE